MLGMEGFLLSQSDVDENLIEIDATDGADAPRIKKITKITEDTEDDDIIDVPYILVPLYTLLAAHYAWLDDDVVKATLYYNQYDSLKNEIITNASRPRRAEIIGGF